MTYQTTAGLTTRLHSLAGRLADLRDRVREAVAVEVGRILGEAIRDLSTAVLRGHLPNPTTTPPPRPGHVHNSGWDDDPDDWERDEGSDPYEPTPEPPTRAPDVELTRSPNWISALTGGVDVARSWTGRTGRWWVGAAIITLTAAASVFNNPTARAALSAFTAFARLVPGAPPTPS